LIRYFRRYQHWFLISSQLKASRPAISFRLRIADIFSRKYHHELLSQIFVNSFHALSISSRSCNLNNCLATISVIYAQFRYISYHFDSSSRATRVIMFEFQRLSKIGFIYDADVFHRKRLDTATPVLRQRSGRAAIQLSQSPPRICATTEVLSMPRG